MKLELNNLIEHVEKNSLKIKVPDHLSWQNFGGGTAIERGEAEEKLRQRMSSSNNSNAPSISRIESCINGNEESWHLLQNRASKGELKAKYIVTHLRVPVRMQPHIDSSILGIKKKSDIVTAVSKHGEWIEVLQEGEKEKTFGWMLTTHVEFGDLLSFHSGSMTLPTINQVLSSVEDAERIDHEHMVTINFNLPKTYRVVAEKTWVPIRAKPKLDATAIGGKDYDAIIRVCARRGDWLQLCEDSYPPAFEKWSKTLAALKGKEEKKELKTKKKSTDDDDDDDDDDDKEEEEKEEEERRQKETLKGEENDVKPPDFDECWMLSCHPQFGQLLAECRADGSDFTRSSSSNGHHSLREKSKSTLISTSAQDHVPQVFTASDFDDSDI